ncbi:hypothetical protein [Brevibacterium samyangense]|uniref:Na+/glutamate symporter n=1 Tax=Brevibacterium samyangense TaxID=366888 RepID=A0ABN2TDS3_9MICO
MSAVLATAIVLAFIALGEIVSIATRARVPALLVAMLSLFVLAKIGIIPTEIVEVSTMVSVGALIQPAIMVHMGSLMPLRTMLQQWRSVLIAGVGIIVATGIILATVWPLFGFEYAVAGAGPIAGGIVSTALTTEGLTEAGMIGAVVVIPSLILMLQSLPSMPLTNFFLRRYAAKLIASGELATGADGADGAATAGTTAEEPVEKKKLVRLPQVLVDNQLFLLFLVFAAGALAYWIGELTGISYSIWGLLVGIVLTALGVIPDKVMERSNSFTIAMAAIIFIVVAPLMTASVADVIASLVPVACILVIGLLGICIGGFVVTKLVGWDPNLGMAVALTAMYGFPADYLITQEVARSTGRTQEESQALLDKMLPPMLIGGFTSVSAGSILVASALVSFL